MIDLKLLKVQPNMQNYIYRKVRNSEEKDWKQWIESQIKEMEETARKNNQRQVLKKVNSH